MNYIAKQDGFIGGFRRRKGQVFSYEGKPGKWMEPVNEQVKKHAPEEPKAGTTGAEKATKGKRKEAEPETFSEMAHRDGEALSTPEAS